MGSYCACALTWPLPELSICGAGQKDRSSGDENALCLINIYSKFQWKDFVIPIIFRTISRPRGGDYGWQRERKKRKKNMFPIKCDFKNRFFPRGNCNDDGETSKILGSDVIPNSITPRFRDDSKIPRCLPKVEILGQDSQSCTKSRWILSIVS